MEKSKNYIIFTRADKGNTIIVTDRSEYINKTIGFIDTSKLEALRRDTIKKFQKQINAFVAESTIFSAFAKYHLTMMNDRPPQMWLSLWLSSFVRDSSCSLNFQNFFIHYQRNIQCQISILHSKLKRIAKILNHSLLERDLDALR